MITQRFGIVGKLDFHFEKGRGSYPSVKGWRGYKRASGSGATIGVGTSNHRRPIERRLLEEPMHRRAQARPGDADANRACRIPALAAP